MPNDQVVIDRWAPTGVHPFGDQAEVFGADGDPERWSDVLRAPDQPQLPGRDITIASFY